MKKYFNIIVILFLAICCSSCLDANLEELDTYERLPVSLAYTTGITMILTSITEAENRRSNKPTCLLQTF